MSGSADGDVIVIFSGREALGVGLDENTVTSLTLGGMNGRAVAVFKVNGFGSVEFECFSVFALDV